MELSVYLTASLFTHAERLWNKRLKDAILIKCPKIKIILPQEETEKASKEFPVPYDKIFKICLEGIDLSDVVVAVLDGADSDSGTCFECGYAFARGKKIIGVRTDIRTGEDRGLNAMLSQSVKLHLIFFSAMQDQNEDIARLAEIILGEIIKLQEELKINISAIHPPF